MPRLFVAVPVPREVAGRLLAGLPGAPGLRPLAAELVHVTLAFVGQVDEEQVAPVVASARAAADGRAPFTLRLERLGRFPEHGPPRLLWVSGADSAPLDALAAAVRAELARRRVPFDAKPFRPHVTLARVGRDATAAQARAIAEVVGRARVEPATVEVAALHVVESRLGPAGPRYSSRAEIPFARAG